jgi:hypothetical protein
MAPGRRHFFVKQAHLRGSAKVSGTIRQNQTLNTLFLIDKLQRKNKTIPSFIPAFGATALIEPEASPRLAFQT